MKSQDDNNISAKSNESTIVDVEILASLLISVGGTTRPSRGSRICLPGRVRGLRYQPGRADRV